MTSPINHLCDCDMLPVSVSGGARGNSTELKIQLDLVMTKSTRGITASSAFSGANSWPQTCCCCCAPLSLSVTLYIFKAISADNSLRRWQRATVHYKCFYNLQFTFADAVDPTENQHSACSSAQLSATFSSLFWLSVRQIQ